MRALEFITGHVIYNPAYTYKFQLKTTLTTFGMQLANANVKKNSWKCILNLTEKHVSPQKTNFHLLSIDAKCICSQSRNWQAIHYLVKDMYFQ